MIIIVLILQVGKYSIPDNSNVLAKFTWNSITCHIYVYLELNVLKNKNNTAGCYACANLSCRRSTTVHVVRYFIDPLNSKDVPNLYIHKQFQGGLCSPPPLPTILRTVEAIVTCDMARCFCSVFC